MAEVQRAPMPIRMATTNTARPASVSYAGIQIPNSVPSNVSAATTGAPSSSLQARSGQVRVDAFSPVNQNGSFEFDRVLKSGYVEKRGRKTRAWKRIYLVLRPNLLSIYKDANEEKLRHKITLSELTAVAYLKDPKQKRQNIFGLFSPARNWHLEAPSQKDVQEWVELIRQQARIEEEEDEVFLASPGGHATGTYVGFERHMERTGRPEKVEEERGIHDDRMRQSSPEPAESISRRLSAARLPSVTRRPSHVEYSGNELASHSDMSDFEPPHHLPFSSSSVSIPIPEEPSSFSSQPQLGNRPILGRNTSQNSAIDPDPERVVWQGYLLSLKSSKGVKQWRQLWAVLRPRNLALYKDISEYSPRLIIPLSSVINAVEIDPVSRTKRFCMQIITEEKSYRFCAHEEQVLDKALGAFKSLLARRDGKKRVDTMRSM